MSNIDELFKRPLLPSQKRKLDPIRNPDEVYKAPKLNGSDSARASAQPTVEDEPDDGGDGSDLEAGPELPPDFEDEGADEDGRFFGGGVERSTEEAMKYLDANDADEEYKEERIDIAWLRRTALNFEKKINKNAELRARFPEDPQKFMASEADLDAEIKTLSILNEHPELYAEFIKLGCHNSLVGLLAHENTDVAIDAIEIIGELIDEDVAANEEQWLSLVDSMLDADFLDLLHANLSRLDESQETDRAGVYNILGVLESLASSTTLADRIGEHKNFLPWLLKRVKHAEKAVTLNKQYSAEVVAIATQASAACRSRFVSLDGVDTFLQLVSVYRKRDPDPATEEPEYMENLFATLACVLDEEAGKAKFLEAEGIELCLILLRDGKASKPRALRLLDHAMAGSTGAECCTQFVEAAGLKPFFSAFMKKHDASSTEHIVAIVASLLRFLPANSAPRIRLLAKFVEKDYQKLSRLDEIRRDYRKRLLLAERSIETDMKNHVEKDELEAFQEEALRRRLEAGMYSIQNADQALAWLMAEDEGARKKILEILESHHETIEELKKSLRDQLVEAGESLKEVLQALLQAI